MLENKNAIITGCNRGIGRSILEIFANRLIFMLVAEKKILILQN